MKLTFFTILLHHHCCITHLHYSAFSLSFHISKDLYSQVCNSIRNNENEYPLAHCHTCQYMALVLGDFHMAWLAITMKYLNFIVCLQLLQHLPCRHRTLEHIVDVHHTCEGKSWVWMTNYELCPIHPMYCTDREHTSIMLPLVKWNAVQVISWKVIYFHISLWRKVVLGRMSGEKGSGEGHFCNRRDSCKHSGGRSKDNGKQRGNGAGEDEDEMWWETVGGRRVGELEEDGHQQKTLNV